MSQEEKGPRRNPGNINKKGKKKEKKKEPAWSGKRGERKRTVRSNEFLIYRKPHKGGKKHFGSRGGRGLKKHKSEFNHKA